MNDNTVNEVQREFIRVSCDAPQDVCTKIGYQYADIRVPIEVQSDAQLGDITMMCCGEPIVDCRECQCGSTCELIITQKYRVKIPINYKLTACMGESTITCIGSPGCLR